MSTRSGPTARMVPPVARAAPSLPAGRISIGRIRLKLPSLDAPSARRVAERAAELAAARVPKSLAGHVSGLSLKVRPRNLSEAAVTEAVADALIQALKRRGGDRA